MVGTEIYATVSSDEKAQYLMDTYGLARSRIFYSRDSLFAEGIMRETDGVGVDLALNSLCGEMLHATWHCVAKFGKMVDISKRDISECGKLDMGVFLGSRSYCCFDVAQLCRGRPRIIKE